eukprot:1148988-Pyramimonas_sp.AAC.1
MGLHLFPDIVTLFSVFLCGEFVSVLTVLSVLLYFYPDLRSPPSTARPSRPRKAIGPRGTAHRAKGARRDRCRLQVAPHPLG